MRAEGMVVKLLETFSKRYARPVVSIPVGVSPTRPLRASRPKSLKFVSSLFELETKSVGLAFDYRPVPFRFPRSQRLELQIGYVAACKITAISAYILPDYIKCTVSPLRPWPTYSTKEHFYWRCTVPFEAYNSHWVFVVKS